MKVKSLVVGLGVTAMALASSSAFALPDLLFSLNHNHLPASGAVASWDGCTAINTPTAQTINGVKWLRNDNLVVGKEDGLLVGHYTSAIPINGASIVTAVKPLTSTGAGNNWTSIVDIFYDQLDLGIDNATGLVCVKRRGEKSVAATATAIPAGQLTVLSLVVQQSGAYKVYANGVQVLSNAGNPFWSNAVGDRGGNLTPTMDYLDPDTLVVTSYPAAPAPFVKGTRSYDNDIKIGRGQDSWSTFNGYIGDTYVFKGALTDAERTALEANVLTSMTTVPEPGSILAMMTGLIGLVGFSTRRKRA